jgi:hypothetical protein
MTKEHQSEVATLRAKRPQESERLQPGTWEYFRRDLDRVWGTELVDTMARVAFARLTKNPQAEEALIAEVRAWRKKNVRRGADEILAFLLKNERQRPL